MQARNSYDIMNFGGDCMKKTQKRAYAKINLTLDVLRKRDDGYHDMAMIMQSINLCDRITVEDSEKFKLTTSSSKLPIGEDNLVYKVYNQLKMLKPEVKPVSINIEKNIPIAAGLAGGSADAAATYEALNEHWNLGLSIEKMISLGVKLGADIPFCIFKGTALAEGIGEKLTRLKSFKDHLILVVNPGYAVSTPSVFKLLDLKVNHTKPDTREAIKAIEDGDLEKLVKSMHNVLGDVTESEHKDLRVLMDSLESKGALKAMISGSGPTVFALFDDEDKLESCYRDIKDEYATVIKSKTI
jgi:4-diphosphocytidyl-2-C-methyl-D-erythritol kinase